MDDDRDRDLRVARRGTGFAAWGPGFYVWEEDVTELLRTAGELTRWGRSRRFGDSSEDARAPRR